MVSLSASMNQPNGTLPIILRMNGSLDSSVSGVVSIITRIPVFHILLLYRHCDLDPGYILLPHKLCCKRREI